jgi:hypothetical protein
MKWFKKSCNEDSKVTTVSEVTGKVEYHRIENVYGKKIGSRSKLSSVFILENESEIGEEFKIEKIENNTISYVEKFLLDLNNPSRSQILKSLSSVSFYKIVYNLNEVNHNNLIKEVFNLLPSFKSH